MPGLALQGTPPTTGRAGSQRQWPRSSRSAHGRGRGAVHQPRPGGFRCWSPSIPVPCWAARLAPERPPLPPPARLRCRGTDGKTTTAYIFEAALRRLGSVRAREHPGDRGGRSWRASRMTTPSAPHIQDLLARMRAARNRSAMMEVSSHALDQERVDGGPLRHGRLHQT
ncbi:Mur ligase family protein [Kocuria rhizophila]|nr:Mur ligase family protein [Kocuria rhizophila]